MRRTSLDRMREDLRLQQVYNTLMRYGMDVVLERTPYVGGFRHGLQTWVWRLPKGWEEPPAAVRLRMMLEELGPTYVKIGQIVSSQASALPADIAEELARLQDDVPSFPSDQVRVAIIEELGAPPEQLYASFEPEPFAAASTAQVHRAFLHDGTKVAVKVQRPLITNKVRSDLGILLNAARVASQRSEMVRTLDVSGMLEQFSSGVLEELDYRGETYNALQLAKNMEGLPGIHVPIIYTRALDLQDHHPGVRRGRQGQRRRGASRRLGSTGRSSPATRCARSSSSSRSTGSSTPTRTPATCS